MTDKYDGMIWNEKEQTFNIRLLLQHAHILVKLSEDEIAKLINDVTKDYYNRHESKLFANTETIYIIEYVDVAGSGIDFITTKEWMAFERWDILRGSKRENPIRIIWSEYINGVMKYRKVAELK